ncbi:MAG: hypothetical protein HYT73_02110 [Candidatus Aenigmarchaeota archaeon]|nr:hypothetical protein [Candidatus Aenigmarchaeota archaeon]
MGMLEDTAQTGRGSYARINAALDLLNRTGNLTTSNRVGRLVNDWSKIYESDPETFNNLISHIGKLIGADKE